MANYRILAKFYDGIMGDRAESAELLRGFIRKAHPEARKVLELACGTGSVLKYLARHYDVWGVDLSKPMLAIARKKVPQARLSHQNMAAFHLQERFDVICCVFDSINHVLAFADWKRLFRSVHRHLSPGGVFIFDINTQQTLDWNMASPIRVHRFGHNFLLLKATAAKRTGETNWNFKIFEHVRGNQYRLHEEDIPEVSFPAPRIVRGLKLHFSSIQIVDADRKSPSPQSERLHFVCK